MKVPRSQDEHLLEHDSQKAQVPTLFINFSCHLTLFIHQDPDSSFTSQSS